MDIKQNCPIMLFDDQCYLCTKFANFFDFFLGSKLTMIGHYSKFGEEIKKEILDETALDMFWIINQDRAYGGRAALFPLMKLFFTHQGKTISKIQVHDKCEQECKTVKAVFVRSASLLRNSRIINI